MSALRWAAPLTSLSLRAIPNTSSSRRPDPGRGLQHTWQGGPRPLAGGAGWEKKKRVTKQQRDKDNSTNAAMDREGGWSRHRRLVLFDRRMRTGLRRGIRN